MDSYYMKNKYCNGSYSLIFSANDSANYGAGGCENSVLYPDADLAVPPYSTPDTYTADFEDGVVGSSGQCHFTS